MKQTMIVGTATHRAATFSIVFATVACAADATVRTDSSPDHAMTSTDLATFKATGDVTPQSFLSHYDALSAERDGAALSEMYAEDATMIVSNGKLFAGRQAIGEFLDAGMAVVKSMKHGAPQVTEVGEAAYLEAAFDFSMKPGDQLIEVTGTRLVVLDKSDGQWRMTTDVWVPEGSKADGAGLRQPVMERLSSIVTAFNAGDAPAARDHYTTGAVVVLTNGKSFRGEALTPFVQHVVDAGIDDLSIDDAEVGSVEGAAYARTRFSVTLKRPDGPPIPLSGQRWTVWHKEGDAWKIAVEVSIPTI